MHRHLISENLACTGYFSKILQQGFFHFDVLVFVSEIRWNKRQLRTVQQAGKHLSPFATRSGLAHISSLKALLAGAQEFVSDEVVAKDTNKLESGNVLLSEVNAKFPEVLEQIKETVFFFKLWRQSKVYFSLLFVQEMPSVSRYYLKISLVVNFNETPKPKELRVSYVISTLKIKLASLQSKIIS